MISISPKDFSFIAEDNFSDIFNLFAKEQVKINVMQNSAISFSVSVDNDERKIPVLIESRVFVGAFDAELMQYNPPRVK